MLPYGPVRVTERVQEPLAQLPEACTLDALAGRTRLAAAVIGCHGGAPIQIDTIRLGMHIPKGYIYFAMGFSVFVEMINLRVRGSAAPVRLREPYAAE